MRVCSFIAGKSGTALCVQRLKSSFRVSLPRLWMLRAANASNPSRLPLAGAPPVYIGFGSIVLDDPRGLLHCLVKGAHLAGVRAIIHQVRTPFLPFFLRPRAFLFSDAV